MAFEVASLDDVVRAARNVPIDFDGRRHAGVQIAMEFRDPDNHRPEVYRGIDRIGPGERARPAHEWKGARSLEATIADPVAGQDTRPNDPAMLDR